jgi:hypothetical protein
VDRQRGDVVFDLFAEGVRQPSESAHRHSHREVLALDIARADMLRIGVSDADLFLGCQARRWAVPALRFFARFLPVDLPEQSFAPARHRSHFMGLEKLDSFASSFAPQGF